MLLFRASRFALPASGPVAKSLSKTNLGLTSIPDFIPDNIEWLIMSYNKIK